MCNSVDSAARWEHFPHEADVGIRGYGPTRDEAFVQAAIGLTAVIVDPAAVQSKDTIRIECSAPDDELLLVDWLNAIVYEMATRKMLFGNYEVSIDGDKLAATAHGEPIDRARHQPAVEVKGATYTSLQVARDRSTGLWVAQCVVDV